jgi:hypothetical protein
MKKPNHQKAFNDLVQWIRTEKSTLIPKTLLINKIVRLKEEYIFPDVNPDLFNEERNKYTTKP